MNRPPRFAIAHLFATGPVGPDHEPVHIGVLPVGEEPTEVREWLCRPGQPLRRRLIEASRLDAKAIADCLVWEAIASDVRAAFSDYDVVYVFNMTHEAHWFEEVILSGTGTRVVDLRLLSAFFLPHRDFTDLKTLCEERVPGYRRGRPQLPYQLQAFRFILTEILDVLLSGGPGGGHPVYAWLSRAVQAGAQEGFDTLVTLAEMACQFHWGDFHAYDAPRVPEPWPLDGTQLVAHIRDLLPEVPQHMTRSLENKTSLNWEFVEGTFKALGRREGDTWRDRPSQINYARFCTEALGRGGIYAAEAGTGTGKTLGYLVPAFEYVRRNPGRKVLIATSTKTLQDQIASIEVALLTYLGALHQDLRTSVLKGKANYLCAGALADAHREYFLDSEATAESMLAWLHLYLRLRYADGTIDDIPTQISNQLPSLPTLVKDVNAEGACTSDLCALGAGCVYPRHLREVFQSDIVVTNHAKLAFLPPALEKAVDAVIIDEADQFPDNLRNALREELSTYRVHHDLLSRLMGVARRRGFLDLLDEHLAEGSGPDGFDPRKAVRVLRTSCIEVQTLLERIGDLAASDSECGERPWFKIEPVCRGFTDSLLSLLNMLADTLRSIAHDLRQIAGCKRYVQTDEGAHGIIGKLREKARIERYAETAEDLAAVTHRLTQDYPSRAYVHTFTGRQNSWTVARLPFELHGAVQRLLIEPFQTVVLTSATLYVDDRLDFFSSQLDLRRPFNNSIRLASPFDYEQHVYGAVTTFLPTYNFRATEQESERWMEGVVETLRALTVATEGRTLVLLTNLSEMRQIYNRLSRVLEAYDIEVICQNGASRGELQRFRESEHTVLLGVDRLWTGIDVPGRSLSQVIVVRLPNPSVSDAVVQHRLYHDGEAMWSNYYQPATRLKLRQGFGRLIRHETDRGLFVVLDARLATQKHMRNIQKELPVRLIEVQAWEDQSVPVDLRRMLHDGLGVARLRAEFEDRGIDPLTRRAGRPVRRVLLTN